MYAIRSYYDPLLKESLELIQSKGLDKVITFFEATLDIKSIIQYSDAVGLFSTFEGFPNAICEAMACIFSVPHNFYIILRFKQDTQSIP